MSTLAQGRVGGGHPVGAVTERKRKRPGVGRIILYAFLIVSSVVWLFPVIWAVFNSFRNYAYTQTHGYLSFGGFTTANYVNAWEQGDFTRHFLNSLIITVPAVVLTLVLSSSVGFVVARFNFRFSVALLGMFTAANLLPPQALLIPLYRLFRSIEVPFWLSSSGTLLDSYWALIAVNVAFQTGFCAFVLANYMKTLPKELYEAAEVDGVSVFRQFWQITLPLVRPALAALAVLETTWIYNEFFWATVLMQSGDKLPVTSSLNNLKGQFFTDYNLLSAGSVIVALPTLIVFFVLQKQFVSGLTLGATKGMTHPDDALPTTLVASSRPVHLRGAGCSLVLDVAGPQLPRVLHWGADLGPLDDAALEAVASASWPAVPRSAIGVPWLLPVLPTEHDNWSGTPGLSGSRSGADSLPRLELVDPVDVQPPPDALSLDGGGGQVVARATGGGLDVVLTLLLMATGDLRVRVRVTNDAEGTYDLAAVTPLLPVPPEADEVLDLTGRWCRERSPQRSPLHHGTHLRTGRRGRSGHDAPVLLVAGTAGFGFRSGEVWGCAVAWSGDATHLVEALPEGAGVGAGVLGGGEALRPGEVRLAPGEFYESPETVFVWSADGLDGLSVCLHRALRGRQGHPDLPRPLVLNIWEAVYFDHDLDRLKHLADVAASIGVERYVVDDGWFGSRRDDTSGLGDWYVSPQVWPDGLAPLFDHVRSLGMQVGLWFEPEMANPDSDVVREHPDWVLTPQAGPWRHQVVLDVANPDAFAYLLERLDSLVGELGIDFIKWDHNRDLHVAQHTRADGVRAAGVHSQTLALYALLDELRARHPGLEIESCASGGGRVDLGILEHTDRVWASDCNDALERQLIQRWTGLVLPPELVGAHIGPPTSHTTGRVLSLPFRATTSLFGHAGIEWDITSCSSDELAALTRWTALYREQRDLLHTGDVVRADLADPGALLHGVVSRSRDRALFAYVRLATSPDAMPGRVRLPGLDREVTYTVRVRDDVGAPSFAQVVPPRWTQAPVRLPGAFLVDVGLPMPVLDPAEALLVEVFSGAGG